MFEVDLIGGLGKFGCWEPEVLIWGKKFETLHLIFRILGSAYLWIALFATDRATVFVKSKISFCFPVRWLWGLFLCLSTLFLYLCMRNYFQDFPLMVIAINGLN